MKILYVSGQIWIRSGVREHIFEAKIQTSCKNC